MAEKNARDIQIQKLFDIVQLKREEIAKAERPNWLTNCTFGYDETSKRINIQVTNDVIVLAKILAFLYGKEGDFSKACTELGVADEFKWMGYTTDEWAEDLKTRVNKIQITKKKRDLELIEGKLDKLISPEMKAQMELDEITKELLG